MTLPRKTIPQRDLQPTGFTAALRRLQADVPGLHSVCFCDEEGEAVDYHSYLEPFDTKIAAAVLGLLLSLLRRECPRLSGRGAAVLLIRTAEHVLFVRPLGGGYYLAGVADADAVTGKLLAALDEAAAHLATEAGL